MRPVLSVTNLWRLDLRHGGLRSLPDDIFRTFPLPNLTTLYLHENKLLKLNFTTFSPLRNLKNLGLANNRISELDSDLMVRLERLNLQRNSLYDFPVTCRNGTSLFPRLTHLFLANSLIKAIKDPVCLPQLEVLELSWSCIVVFATNMFHATRFPSLTTLHLQNMNAPGLILEAHAFGNPSLKQLNLIYNDIVFGTEKVHPDCFAGCSNLVTLEVSHNIFDNVSHGKWQQLFTPLGKLQTFLLGYGKLTSLFKDAFNGLGLLRTINLYQNAISDLPDGVFDGLNLTFLGMGKNKLTVIKESAFNVSTRKRFTHLDLSGNPFQCGCELLWFKAWYTSEPDLFSHSWTTYDCHNLPGKRVASFHVNLQACLLSRATSTFITASVSMVIVVMALASLLFRYRWHIRLLLYEAFRGRGADRHRLLQEQQFKYDVFVSYAAEDCDWVFESLKPRLEEGGMGLRLCLHQRNFTVGKNIVDNIMDCMQESKKVMVVFSTSYARSRWCQFELIQCIHHVIDWGDNLVVVCLGHVPLRDMTSAMMAVCKTTTYIQWGQDPEVQAAFWGRLAVAFHDLA